MTITNLDQSYLIGNTLKTLKLLKDPTENGSSYSAKWKSTYNTFPLKLYTNISVIILLKLIESTLLTNMLLLVDHLIIPVQAGCLKIGSTAEQILSPITHIENGF
ncbi:hypothetical protein RF11_10234 [Thelohanellus kitauei]|uniref:Uncharacterized protein n=1 Tax=Thelohanellus kitauei TaxID=669202 RepID=A0A0C2NDC2_THEKT|nr:hypothetical protein RF11_10234 [Thelohanellus kitauei]